MFRYPPPARHACTVALLAVVFGGAPNRPAHGYEAQSTHAGITAKAALRSQLHAALVGLGAKDGLLHRLSLVPDAMQRDRLTLLVHQLSKVDPATGAVPDKRPPSQWALGWLVAGSIVAGLPAVAERNHFYSPPDGRGLSNDKWPASPWLALLIAKEGGGSLINVLAGTGFDFTGQPAPSWIRSEQNPYSIDSVYDELVLAVRSPTPAQRHHHLALALVALGGVLHVLQDMGSPTHTRNDFRVGHLQRLGNSTFDRGSPYERYVAVVYGRTGMSFHAVEPVVRSRFVDYFSGSDKPGLANISHANHFSPGTLPKPLTLHSDANAADVEKRLQQRLPYAKPALGPLDLDCARKRTCYVSGTYGPQVAYRVSPAGKLTFAIDRRCMAATARHLLPQTVAFSAGLINHVFRSNVDVSIEGQRVTVHRTGGKWAVARVTWLAEDARGIRKVVSGVFPGTASTGDEKGVLGSIAVEHLASARRLIALVVGEDGNRDPALAVASIAASEDSAN